MASVVQLQKREACLNSGLKIGLFVKCGAFCDFFQVLFLYPLVIPFQTWDLSAVAFPHHVFPAAQPDFAMFEELMCMKTITYQKIWVTQSILISQRRLHPSLSRTRATLGCAKKLFAV